jgi:hypothetical protein
MGTNELFISQRVHFVQMKTKEKIKRNKFHFLNQERKKEKKTRVESDLIY